MDDREQHRREIAIKLARPADIILYRVSSKSKFFSKLVGWLEPLIESSGSESWTYSHASLIDKNMGYQLEAVWPRTSCNPIDWMNEDLQPELWRVKNFTDMQREDSVRWATDNLGLKYDWRFLLFGWRAHNHEMICSEYVHAAILRGGGVCLVPNPQNKRICPNELAESFKLERLV